MLDVDFGHGAHGTCDTVELEGDKLEIVQVNRTHMKIFRRADVHHAQHIRNGDVMDKMQQGPD